MQKNMKNRLIDQKKTKQVLIDAGLHRLLKMKAAAEGKTIRVLLDEYLAELLAVDKQNTGTH
jgi:hypothetical protein